jgi:hypothetical protein
MTESAMVQTYAIDGANIWIAPTQSPENSELKKFIRGTRKLALKRIGLLCSVLLSIALAAELEATACDSDVLF